MLEAEWFYDPYILNANIKKLLKQSGMTLSQLSAHIGVPIATIKRIESDPKANPTIATLVPIAKFFKIEVDQLIGKDVQYPRNNIDCIKIPLFFWNSLTIYSDNFSAKNTESFYTIKFIDNHENVFAVLTEDQSWHELLDRSILIFDSKAPAKNKDFLLVNKVGAKSISLKQVLIEDDQKYLRSLNSYCKVVPFNNNYKILGKLIKLTTDFKS